MAEGAGLDGFSFSFDLFAQFGTEDFGVEGGQVGGGDAFFGDEDAFEEPEAEFASDARAAGEVDLGAVVDPFDGLVEGALHGLVLHGQRSDDAFGGGSFAEEAPLFFLEQGQGDGLGVVGLEQFVFFGVEAGQAVSLVGEFGLVGVGGQGDELGDVGLDGVEFSPADADSVPVALDVGFDLFHGQVRELAAVGLVAVAAEAEEVGVALALLARVVGDGQPPAAPGAAEDAFEVVGAFDRLLLTDRALIEDGLDVIEQPERDERGVSAGVLDAVVSDETDVVGVAQQLVDPAA